MSILEPVAERATRGDEALTPLEQRAVCPEFVSGVWGNRYVQFEG